MKPESEHEGGDCRPVKELLDKIGDKWTVLIVTRLSARAMRFSELKRDIGDISPKMLTSALRELEKDGIVTRMLTPLIPPRVDYELTELGRDLLVPLNALGAWAIRNQQRIAEARARFESRQRAGAAERPPPARSGSGAGGAPDPVAGPEA